MDLFWGIAGAIFGAVVTILAKYRRQDIEEEKIRRRSFALGYLHGRREKVVALGQRDPVKCRHCGNAHHSSYCEE